MVIIVGNIVLREDFEDGVLINIRKLIRSDNLTFIDYFSGIKNVEHYCRRGENYCRKGIRNFSDYMYH